MGYTKEQIALMKQRAYNLRYNLSCDSFEAQKNVFMDLELNFPGIKDNTNQAVRYEYDRRGISVITKSYWQLDKMDVDIWSYCYIANLRKEITAYERLYGYVDLELSAQFNDFINNKNNITNQERLFVKDGGALRMKT